MGPAKPGQSKPAQRDTKHRLHEAALRLVVTETTDPSVRAIARAAGVSEGALYRHYASREELFGAIYAELVAPMIAHKEGLVAMRAPIADRLREWVRSTYERFDRDPDGFAYIFLTTHNLPERYASIAGRQSSLFKELVRQGQGEGTLRPMPPELAAGLFAGLLRIVPERVRVGALPAPASAYTDDVFGAVWAVLGAEGDEP